MTPNYILVVFTNIVLLVGASTIFFNGYSAKMTGYIMMLIGSIFSLVTISNQVMNLDGVSIAGIFVLYIAIMGMITMMLYLRRRYKEKWDVLEENDVKKITNYETYLAIVLLILMIMMSYLTHIMGRPNVVLVSEDMSKFAMFYLLSCVFLAMGIAFTNLIRIITTRFLTDGFTGQMTENHGHYQEYEPYDL